jgi:CheY-like chemotaxis protein
LNPRILDTPLGGKPKAIVLVVDARPDRSNELTRVVWNEGYSAIAIGNALEAHKLLDGGLQPHLIVLDVEMPGGWALWDRRQQSATLRAVPVVALSSTPRAAGVGDAHVLTSPIDAAAFASHLRACLGAPVP